MIAHGFKRLICVFLLALPMSESISSRLDTNSAVFIDYADSASHGFASLERIRDPAFLIYAKRLLKAIQEQFGSVQVQPAESPVNWQEGLSIVRIPLVSGSGQPILGKKVAEQPLDGDCVVEAPWLNIKIRYLPRASITGVIYWSERQLLLDRAVIHRLTTDGLAPLQPFQRSTFELWAKKYSEKFIDHEMEVKNENLIALGAPVELLQLFRESPQSTFIPFDSGASGTMRSIAEKSAERYALLVAGILKKCSKEESGTLRYSTIEDALGEHSAETFLR